MSTPTARQPRGIPVAGQFAPTTHAEPSLSLGAPSVQPDFVRDRLRQLGVLDHLTEAHVAAVTEKLNESLDFSDRNIEETAEQVHVQDRGYSVDTARKAQAGLDRLRGLSTSGKTVGWPDKP